MWRIHYSGIYLSSVGGRHASCVKLFRVMSAFDHQRAYDGKKLRTSERRAFVSANSSCRKFHSLVTGMMGARTHGQDHKGGLQSVGQSLVVPTGTFATLALAGTLHVVEATMTSSVVAATNFSTCCCGTSSFSSCCDNNDLRLGGSEQEHVAIRLLEVFPTRETGKKTGFQVVETCNLRLHGRHKWSTG